jgi:hypothetical protein
MGEEMKKRWFVLSIILIITIFTFLPISPLKANPGNLVQNGDFAGGSLNFWNTWGDIRMYQDAAGLYSTTSNTSGMSQVINTTEKNLIFSCDISPRYSGGSSRVQIAFNIYKNGAQLGQAFGYFNNLPPMQSSHVSFKVSDFWSQNTGAIYADFDQIEIIAETYYGCIAFFDNFELEAAPSPGTTLEVTKNATAEGEGYLTWTIDKSVDKKSFDLSIGTTATAKYTVTVKPTYHETGITVSGNINIANSGSETASVSYVKDRIEYKIGNGPWTELTTKDISGPFTIPAGNTSNVPYSVSFTPVEGATAYQNTALVGLANYSISGGGVGFQEFSYTTGFSVSGGTITSDAYADVSDSLQGYLGEAWVGDPTTYKYTYSNNIGPYSSVGNYKIDNTATVTGKDTNTAVTDSASVKVHVTGKGTITVYKDLMAPDGKSEPLIADNHGFKITLQKSTSSGWEDVESRTIKDGSPQVFEADMGVSYRVVEAKDDDYVQITGTGAALLEKNGQNIDIFLKNKQKPALIKLYMDVTDSSGANISDNHWFWVRLKGGNRTIYQPFNESFYTFFVLWPGKYTVAEFTDTNYRIKDDREIITAYSNGKYKGIMEMINISNFLGNLLINGDFETGDFTGWILSGGQPVTEGLLSAINHYAVFDSTGGHTAWFDQSVDVSDPNLDFSYSIKLLNNDLSGGGSSWTEVHCSLKSSGATVAFFNDNVFDSQSIPMSDWETRKYNILQRLQSEKPGVDYSKIDEINVEFFFFHGGPAHYTVLVDDVMLKASNN